MEIFVPSSIKISHLKNKVVFQGNKNDIDKFVQEFYKLEKLENGQKCKLEKYTLKLSEYLTEDRNKKNWIELPKEAWLVMGSKFREVADGEEDNPFDFNDCVFIDKNPFDIGIEVIDLPIRYMKFDTDGSYKIIEEERY